MREVSIVEMSFHYFAKEYILSGSEPEPRFI